MNLRDFNLSGITKKKDRRTTSPKKEEEAGDGDNNEEENKEGNGQTTLDPATQKYFNFEEIVEYVTAANTNPRIIQDFLLTYRSFTTAEALLTAIIDRCNTSDEVISLRCFVLLRSWVDKFSFDFQKDHDNLVSLLTNWSEALKKSDNQKLLKMVDDLFVRINKPKKKNLLALNFFDNAPLPIIPAVKPEEYKLLDIDSVEIARQITLIEEALWRSIQPWECLGWNKPSKEQTAPNICKFISWFNDMNFWVQTEILTEIDNRTRVKVLQKFVDICDQLVSLNNFNGAFEIMSSLNSTAIFRLKKHLSGINSKKFEKLRHTLRSQDNFKNVRNTLHTLSPPCIPYLGMYLTDLTFIEEGNPDEVDGKINFHKRKMIATTISEIMFYQQPPYCLKASSEIQQYLTNTKKMTDESLLYKFSLFYEPRDSSSPNPPPAELVEIAQQKGQTLKAKTDAPKGKKTKLFKPKPHRDDTETEGSKYVESTETSSIFKGGDSVDSSFDYKVDEDNQKTTDESLNKIYENYYSTLDSLFQRMSKDIMDMRENTLSQFSEDFNKIKQQSENSTARQLQEKCSKQEKQIRSLKKENERLRNLLKENGVTTASSNNEQDQDQEDQGSQENQ
uniref:Ras-GEF domain-containing protein n=1 Tax=Arcella intermedia TaxID=1963864 RepID=A0A6B2KZ98_9EUKA